MTYGVFDAFGAEHAAFLRRAMGYGNELIIGCATDAYARALGFAPMQPFEQRKEMLEHCRHVDRVIELADTRQIRTDIVNHNAAVLILGPENVGDFENVQDIAQIQSLADTIPRDLPLKWAS